MARFLLVPHPTLGLPLPVESAPAGEVIGEMDLTEEELRAWQELVARALLDACARKVSES